MYLGRYFTVAELCHSGTAVRLNMSNQPGPREMQALSNLCQFILDPLRAEIKRPIVITSGYRSPAVNRKVGGAPRSQHMLGEAADIVVPGMTPAQVIRVVHGMRLPFDQAIEEFGEWVHISYGRAHRRQTLRARKVNGRTVYTPY